MTAHSVLNAATIALVIAAMCQMVVGSVRTGYVTQVGSQNRRQREKLAADIAAWPRRSADAVVNWHDYPALSKLDIAELLHPRGWFYAGQDMHGERWPLFVTTDRSRAVSTDPPPTRLDLLHAELREADCSGRGVHILDLTPYISLGVNQVEDIARRAGWIRAVGVKLPTWAMRLVRPGLPAIDQWAEDDDPDAADTTYAPGSDEEPNPINKVPRKVQRKINIAGLLGFVLLAVCFAASTQSKNPNALHVLLVIGAVVLVPFVILTVRAGRAYDGYKRDRAERRGLPYP